MAMFGDDEEMTVYRAGTQIPDKKAMAALFWHKMKLVVDTERISVYI